MRKSARFLFALAFGMAAVEGFATAADAPQTLTQKIAGMERKDGFFPLDWEAKSGKLYLEIRGSTKISFCSISCPMAWARMTWASIADNWVRAAWSTSRAWEAKSC